jgi:DNA-binding MarR family transcriptional regulator
MTERATRDTWIMAIDRLIHEVTWHAQKQAIHTLMRPEIALTLPQMVTLFAIHQRGACRMGALAEATQQSGGTITGIVDRLIHEGLVKRVRSNGDRRVVKVALTPAGEERVRRVLDARHKDMDQILARFNDHDLEQFERLLRLFVQGVQDHLAQDAYRSSAAPAVAEPRDIDERTPERVVRK